MGTSLSFKILVLSLSFCGVVNGQSIDSLIQVEDLTLRMITVSEDEVTLATDLGNHNILGLFVGQSESFTYLSICNEDPFNVWIENRLHFDNLSCWNIKKDSLFDVVKADSLFVVIQTAGDFINLQASTLESGDESARITNKILPRVSDNSTDFVIFFFLTVILIVGVMKTYFNSIFQDIYSFSLSGRIRSSDRQQELDFGFIFLSIFTSLLLAFAYWYVKVYSSPFYLSSFSENFTNLIIYSTLIAFALSLKYVFVLVIARLNGFQTVAFNQIYDFVRFLCLISLLIFSIIMCKYWLDVFEPVATGSFWRHYFTVGYSLFILYFYYKLGVTVRYRKLHIISYLCTTEILGAAIIALVFAK